MKGILPILIAGTSHTGKTTLAHRLATKTGAQVVSTDSLARHPGRPWPGVRPQVAEFYARLSPKTVHWFLQVHHENLWPALSRMIDGAGDGTVFEGSALRPEYIAGLMPRVTAVCLHAPPEFLRDRMLRESGHAGRSPAERQIIDAFIDRSLRDNAANIEAAREHRLLTVDVSHPGAVEQLVADLTPHPGT